ncbi:hypothetical protein D3C72_1309040 [compost metagenome]
MACHCGVPRRIPVAAIARSAGGCPARSAHRGWPGGARRRCARSPTQSIPARRRAARWPAPTRGCWCAAAASSAAARPAASTGQPPRAGAARAAVRTSPPAGRPGRPARRGATRRSACPAAASRRCWPDTRCRSSSIRGWWVSTAAGRCHWPSCPPRCACHAVSRHPRALPAHRRRTPVASVPVARHNVRARNHCGAIDRASPAPGRGRAGRVRVAAADRSTPGRVPASALGRCRHAGRPRGRHHRRRLQRRCGPWRQRWRQSTGSAASPRPCGRRPPARPAPAAPRGRCDGSPRPARRPGVHRGGRARTA